MEERCTLRQLRTALFAALLAPAAALPSLLVRGGNLGWLGPVLAFPLGLFLLWRLKAGGTGGLAAAWRGRPALLTLYYIWAMALSALTAGGCVDRLHRTDYLETPGWLLSLALVGVTAYLVRRGIPAFFRAAEIFCLVLLGALALFLPLGAASLKVDNLLPRDWGALAGAAWGAVPATSALSVGVLAAFFPRETVPGSGKSWRWLAGWCLAAAGLCLLVTGALGADLAREAPLPFFLALQGLGSPGGFQRLEALGTTLWVLSDLTLLGLAALAGREMAGRKSWAAAPVLAAAFLGGCLLPNQAVERAAPWVLGVDLALGAVLPVALSLLPAPEGTGRGGTSCG